MATRSDEAERSGDLPADLRQPEARTYRRAARRRGRIQTVASLAVLVASALAAGRLAAVVDGQPAPLRGAFVALVAGAVLELVAVPFAIAGHRAARRAGLSRQTGAGAAADQVKGLAIGALVGLPAAALLVAAQRDLGSTWPLAAWGAALAFSILVTIAFPVVLLPLFLRSEPLEGGPLRTMADELVGRSRLAVRDVRLLRLGEKTSGANAAVVGIGPTRRILVGDTLAGLDGAGADAPVAASRLAETRAVLAHELAHHAHGDLWRGLALQAALSLAEIAAAAGVLALLPARLAHGGAGDPAALPALALALAAVGLPGSLLGAWHSRRRERAADAYACRLTDGAALARAFERLAVSNLAELAPPWFDRVRGSHPPLAERIRLAREELSLTGRNPGR